EAIAKASAKTNGGRDIDAHQPHAERVAYLATEVEAAKRLRAYADELEADGAGDPQIDDMTLVFAAEVAAKAASQLDAHLDDFGLDTTFLERTLAAPAVRGAIRAALGDDRLTALGRHQLATRGVNNCHIDEIAGMARDAVRQFAATEVAPIAEHLHRHDDLIPEELIRKMAELGYFG